MQVSFSSGHMEQVRMSEQSFCLFCLRSVEFTLVNVHIADGHLSTK